MIWLLFTSLCQRYSLPNIYKHVVNNFEYNQIVFDTLVAYPFFQEILLIEVIVTKNLLKKL
jgi:hypothetical protein